MTMRMSIRSGADNIWVERTAGSIARIKPALLSEEEEEKVMKKHDMRQAIMIEAAFFPKRVLGADLGLKKPGLAISDELGGIRQSLRNIQNGLTQKRYCPAYSFGEGKPSRGCARYWLPWHITAKTKA